MSDRDCIHGSLARLCDRCETETALLDANARIAELENWKRVAMERGYPWSVTATDRIRELEAGLTKILDTRKGHILGGCDTDADWIDGYSRIVNMIWDTAAAAMKGGNDAERA